MLLKPMMAQVETTDWELLAALFKVAIVPEIPPRRFQKSTRQTIAPR